MTYTRPLLKPSNLEWTEAHWVAILGAFTFVLLLTLGVLNTWLLNAQGEACALQALTLDTPTACKATLKNAIDAPKRLYGAPFFIGVPELLVWADNLLTDMYTVYFIGYATWAYREITTLYSDPIRLWRAAITVTCLLAIAGGVLDHAENFWLLANMDGRPQEATFQSQLNNVAAISAAKFQLAALNLVVALAWMFTWLGRHRRFGKDIDDLRTLANSADSALRERLGLPPAGWPSALGYRPQQNLDAIMLTPRRWQALLYLHFLKRSRGRSLMWRHFNLSFSTYALDHWLHKVLDKSTVESKALLLEYLNELAQQGYLLPQGKRRFGIVNSDILRDLMKDDEPAASDACVADIEPVHVLAMAQALESHAHAQKEELKAEERAEPLQEPQAKAP
ncbi:hypothetical protein [Variovorax sp. RCC_210]|uniref:hypothetical protein n=1 Tax=Variovorax sp. RCC_210 TaxID=3239217 RepID=UPI00352550E0